MKFTWKVTYPDGDVEFWYNTVAETISVSYKRYIIIK